MSGAAPNASDTHLDVDALDEWIGDRLPGHGERLAAERLGAATGMANTLFLLRRGEHRWVFRQPPPLKNDPSASDTVREWRILTALEGTPVPHPTPLLLCENPGVLGRPFMIMSVVDGFTPGFELPEPFLSDPALRHDLAMAYVDGCAALAQVDWRGRGLDGLGKPDGFLERQVPRWLAQLDRYRTRHLPELDFVTTWLEAYRPTMSAAAIIHGDYSPFNVMVAPDAPARLAAIVDWDTGTIGDPLLDIGHLLARWTEPGETPILDEQAGGTEGYPSRAEMAQRYAERTGRDLSALAYYEALALFKLAVILEGTYARQRAAGVPDAENTMAELVPRLILGAAEFARGGARVTETLVERRRRLVRDEIGRVAIELFAERGFDAVTVDDIADAAGTSQRTFFRYFATKDDIVLALSRRLDERLVAALDARPPEEGAVAALREAYCSTSHVEPAERIRVLQVARVLAEAPALRARAHGEYVGENHYILARLAARMGVAEDDRRVRVLAGTFAAVASVEFTRWAEAGGGGDPSEAIRGALALLEQGLSALDGKKAKGRPR